MQVRELVAAHLRPIQDKGALLDSEFSLSLWDQACPIVAETVANSGVGIDHFGGEHVLAAMLQRETPRGYEHRLCGAITDRRTIVGGWSSIKGGYNDSRFQVAHVELAQVDFKDSMLRNFVKLVTHHGVEHSLTFPAATKQLGPFYRAMLGIPPQARVAPLAGLPQPHAEDPAACQAIGQSLWRPDPRASGMLAGIDQQVRAGNIDAGTGYDFACRLLLAHRSAITGPGSNGQQWLSPLSANDLVHTVASFFGPPIQLQPVYPGFASYQFRVDPRRDALGPVLTGLGIAAYVGLGVGFSPGKVIAHQLMAKQPLTGFRLSVADTTACSTYLLDGPRGRLELGEGSFAHGLHQALIHTAYRVLEGRVARGWQIEYAGLF